MSAGYIKCVIIGDGAVGKTCLLARKIQGEFLSDYVPTVGQFFSIILRCLIIMQLESI